MWMITSNLTGVVGKTAFDVWYFGFLMVERLLSCQRSWEGMCVYLRIAGHPKSSFYQYWILNIGLKVASSSLQLLQNKKQSYVSLPDLKKLRETPAQERILLKMFTGISPSTKKWQGLQSLNNCGSWIWSNYSDLTGPHPKWWFSKGNPLISGKARLVKYYSIWPDECQWKGRTLGENFPPCFDHAANRASSSSGTTCSAWGFGGLHRMYGTLKSVAALKGPPWLDQGSIYCISSTYIWSLRLTYCTTRA